MRLKLVIVGLLTTITSISQTPEEVLAELKK